MRALKQLLPADAIWSAFSISRQQFTMAAQAVILGGRVRVDLEDNLDLSRRKLSQKNGPSEERAAPIIRELEFSMATPAQAREILCIG